MKGFRSRPEKAFTLIELLVVVAIISLLVSILLPSLQKAKDLARMAVCMTQEKQMGTGFGMYASDHDDFIPRAGYEYNYSIDGTVVWDYVISPYLGYSDLWNDRWGKTVFTCPADEIPREWPPYEPIKRSYLINDEPILGGFFTNDPYCPVGKKLTDIPQPSGLILVTCQPTWGSFISGNSWACMGYCGVGLGQIPGSGNPAQYPFLQNHQEGTNFLFCDFHVEWLNWKKTVSVYFGGSASNSELWYLPG